VAVSVTSYYLMEVRLMRLGHQISARLARQPAAPLPPKSMYATASAGRR
jgi:hypothetical protein